MDNFGVILEENKPSDWIYGGQGDFFSPLDSVKLINNHDWTKWLPTAEEQNNGGFDRMACVTFSHLNTLEILYKNATGKEINFSDRYIATLSGTSNRGNTLARVFDTSREYGLVKEEKWQDEATDWKEYYTPVSNSIIEDGKKFIKDWDLYREYVPTYNRDKIFEALNYAPLQVIVEYASGDGILFPGQAYSHAVTCYKAVYGEYWGIFDHYTQTTKKYAWNYEFASVLKPTFKSKVKPMFKPTNNHFYQLVQGSGGFAMGLDGKLVIDRVELLQASFIMRNQGDINGKAHALNLKDWNSVAHVNLKGETIK